MERDFFGLSSKNGVLISDKQHAADKPKDPATVSGSGMQWSFSNNNKLSGVPRFLSFKVSDHEDTTTRPSSSPHITMQKSLSMGKQVGNKHVSTVYTGSTEEARVFSISNQSNQTSHITLQSNSPMKSHPHASSVLPPSNGSIVGTTDLIRNSSKSTSKPTQMTIFYAGSVCVYEDICAEKAQAIMLMAGKRCNPTQNMEVSTQKTITRSSKDDGFILSQSYPSPLPSPLPVTFHAGSRPEGGSSSSGEHAMMRPVGGVGSSFVPSSHLESLNIVASTNSTAAKMAPPVGLPLARKASLARFLEKRKERATSTSPYNISKKSSSECSTPRSDGVSFTMNSSGSCALPAIN